MKAHKSRALIKGKITSLLRKNMERDQPGASPQSSPIINHMLITNLICIQ